MSVQVKEIEVVEPSIVEVEKPGVAITMDSTVAAAGAFAGAYARPPDFLGLHVSISEAIELQADRTMFEATTTGRVACDLVSSIAEGERVNPRLKCTQTCW